MNEELVQQENLDTIKENYLRIAIDVNKKENGFKDENKYFSSDDFLGKTWYRLFKELDEIDSRKKETPQSVRMGMEFGANLLAGLWLTGKKQQKLNVLTPMTDKQIKKIETDFKPYEDIVKMHLRKEGRLPTENLIGLLIMETNQNIDKQLETMALQKEELRLGYDIAWNKWKAVSTDA